MAICCCHHSHLVSDTLGSAHLPSHTSSSGSNRWNMDALTSQIAVNGCRVLSPLHPDAFHYDANLAIFIYSVVFFSFIRIPQANPVCVGEGNLAVKYSWMRLVDNRQSFGSWSSLQGREFLIYFTSVGEYLFLVSSWITPQWEGRDTGKRFQGNMRAIWEKWDLSIMRVYVAFTAPAEDIIKHGGWVLRSTTKCAQKDF